MAEEEKSENLNQKSDEQKKEPVQLSQEQLDRMIGDRAVRASDAALKKKAKDLGFESVKDMDDAVKDYNTKKESEKDELTKLKDENEKLKRMAGNDVTRIESLSIKGAFEVEALKNGIQKTSGAYALAKSENLLADVSYDPETDLVSGVTGAIKALIEKYPEFVAIKGEDSSKVNPVRPNQSLRNTSQTPTGPEKDGDEEFANFIRGGGQAVKE